MVLAEHAADLDILAETQTVGSRRISSASVRAATCAIVNWLLKAALHNPARR